MHMHTWIPFILRLDEQTNGVVLTHEDVKLVGDVTNLLQMRIVRTHSTLCLDQERQIAQFALECEGQHCKTTLTPIEPCFDLRKSSDTALLYVLFQAVGEFPTLARHTRPRLCSLWCTWLDSAHGVKELFMHALCVLKYLYTTKVKGLSFRGDNAAFGDGTSSVARLRIYFDTDWALSSVGHSRSRKSFSGNAIIVNGDSIHPQAT